MFPEIAHWGPIHIRSYGLMLAAAFLVGTWISLREARRLRLDEDKLVSVILVTLIVSVFGARLLYVLEHLEDPVAALRAARPLAGDGALLLAVVPNVGHLSVVRDLLLGRHDPVPAGLCDAGHLRWFSKPLLAETMEESGWTLERIVGLPGAAPPDPEPFLALAGSWPDADLESLRTYQWIATARP